ncbi:MAG: TerB family tellurite resistance protein [Candidatus Sabulitectum sp.]|nr:TerB family tellurite resistance protein [Candidatus Sabulitectum sp.]
MNTIDFTKVPQDQLVAYYGLGFAAAASDGSMDREELQLIFETLDISFLDDVYQKEVRQYVLTPPSVISCLNKLKGAPEALRFGVVVSVMEVLLADDIITSDEAAFLRKICTRLEVNQEQQDAIKKFILEAKRIKERGLDDNTAEKALKNALSGVTAVGVPIAAVYLSGSVIGLSAAGITSGLAALGLGIGMIPGIGVAIVLGTAIFLGLRAIFGDSKKTKEKKLRLEAERKAQLAIKNLQDMISMILDRISNLEKKTAGHKKNARIISDLQKRLSALRGILARKRTITAKASG